MLHALVWQDDSDKQPINSHVPFPEGTAALCQLQDETENISPEGSAVFYTLALKTCYLFGSVHQAFVDYYRCLIAIVKTSR